MERVEELISRPEWWLIKCPGCGCESFGNGRMKYCVHCLHEIEPTDVSLLLQGDLLQKMRDQDISQCRCNKCNLIFFTDASFWVNSCPSCKGHELEDIGLT